MEKKDKKKLSEDEILKQREQEEKEREIQSILMKADENKEEVISFDDGNGEIKLKDEVQAMLDEPIDNPSEKYELYYKVVNKILRDHLPKGKENEEARSYIYEEKNTFLTRGHRIDGSGLRHADGRMGYNADMKELIDILVEWSSANGTMFDLYTRLRDLNESKGYGKPEIEK